MHRLQTPDCYDGCGGDSGLHCIGRPCNAGRQPSVGVVVAAAVGVDDAADSGSDSGDLNCPN